MWRLDEGIRWQKAPRQFAGRGLAYWTDGNDRARHRRHAGLSHGVARREDRHARSEVRQERRRRPDGRPRLAARAARGGRLRSARSSATPRRLRKARPGETWDPVKKTGADGTVGIDPALGQIARQLAGDHRQRRDHRRQLVASTATTRSALRNLPGYIRGFDIRTGKQLWKFNLVPQPGEFGAETWKNGSKIGTEGVGKNDAWATYSADPELGLVYIPVGMPLMDEYGGHRPGDNLYGNSLVAHRREDRQAQVALPDGASRHLGLRHADGAEPARRHRRTAGRARSSRRRRSRAGSTCSIARPASRSGRSSETPVLQSEVPGEETCADAADSDEAGAVLAAGARRGRPDRLHAGDQGLGAQAGEAVPDGAVLHPGRR